MSSKQNNIANLSDQAAVLDSVAKFFRVMSKAGLTVEDLTQPIQSIKKRNNLVQFFKSGCPTVKEDGSVKSIIPPKSQVLRRISKPGEIILQPTDGKKTFAKAKDIFKGYLDSNFKDWKIDESAPATKERKMAVYEMAEDANFADMFGSLHTNLDKLCLTQHQAIQFVLDYRHWLRKDGYATLFLFKAAGEFFVAYVFVHSAGELFVGVNRFVHDSVWDAGDEHRVVVPQLQ